MPPGKLASFQQPDSSKLRARRALGTTVSYAALAACTAALASLLAPGEALAGTCVESAPGSGVWVCSDPANPADTSQTINGSVPVSVTTSPGFGITAAVGNAIVINAGPGVGSLTFTDAYASVITGAQSGINALNLGSGALAITSTGMATGVSFDGIRAVNANYGTDLSISAADSSGGLSGINATNFGSGALTITSTGTAMGANFSGIYAYNSTASTDLTITAVDSSGGRYGIRASNSGSGALSITSTGAAAGVNGDGINAVNFFDGTDLTISAADSGGGINGISAINLGSGALSITSTGAAVGANSNGIYASNYSSGTDLTINAADSSGGRFGINARNRGTGALSITSTGTATGTGLDGIYAYNSDYGTDLTVTAVDSSGGRYGINARNRGSGALSITSTGTAAGANADGIFAVNSYYGTDLTITAADSSGGFSGIRAINFGSGALSIASTGTATGAGLDGINARNGGDLFSLSTDLTITAADSSGGRSGIFATNRGSGALSITSTGTATGTNYSGIYAYNSTASTDLTISAADSSGGRYGIHARNFGTGALSITSTGMAEGTNYDGIRAINDGTDLTINAANSSGGYSGIYARNRGSGALSITSTGTAAGTNYSGINAYNSSAGTDLTINAADSSGNIFGITALNLGTGALSITSTGTATGANNEGIRAFNYGTDLTISAADSSGGESGINAFNNGSGALTITSTGTATGTNYTGIYAFNFLGGTDLTISAADSSGGYNGIYAVNLGSGALSITSTGTAAGTNNEGIRARNYGTDLTISAADSTGGESGINAFNNGSGALSITSTGMATGTNYSGIRAFNSYYGTDLTITAADSSGGFSGIDARNFGTGALSITSTGTAAGANDDGIRAFNSYNGTDLTITAADSSGGSSGINALNFGTGALSITSAGTAAGANVDGIRAFNSYYGTDLTISAADSSGGIWGIYGVNRGTGALSITSTGTATGTGLDGIYAYNSDYGTDLTISAADSSGRRNGINARNYGTGALSITSTGTASGTNNNGINAFNSSAGTELTINSADSSGRRYGIYVRNYGAGALSITSTGTVTGTSLDGINALNFTSGTDLTISAADSSGGFSGIDARNFGTGALSITSTGTASGASVDGINAFNFTRGTDLTITAADSSGGRYGIYALNSGTGALSITSTGAATGAGNEGIFAFNYGTDLTISAADSSGGRNGIYAVNLGSGALSITSTGTATGSNGSGIYAINYFGGTDLTIAAADSSGGRDGIYAVNLGSGTLSIASTGTATGTNGSGIYAINYFGGTDLTISAVDTSGGIWGIIGLNGGSGALSITSNGTVVGADQDGIFAYNSYNGTDLTITAADSSGGISGIIGLNGGSGALSITSNGTVVGADQDGIFAYNSYNGTDLTINAVDSSGGRHGIYSVNYGTGTLSITSTGTATGTNYSGISAFNSTSGTDLTITAADSSGGRHGIYSVNYGTGTLAITSTGTATGGLSGIRANQQGAGALTIGVNLASGAVGIAADATTGPTTITLASTAIVTGTAGAGIDARSVGGAITVRGSSGTIIGATDGIYARSLGGNILVDNLDLVRGNAGDGLDLASAGGNITVQAVDSITGVGGNGILANASGGTGGLISITGNGTIAGSIDGINAVTDGSGTVTIATGGTTYGLENGINVSTSGGAVTVTNSGNLSGGSLAFAAGADTGPVTLTNSGAVSGAIRFAAGADSFTNSGLFNAVGTSDFGGGADSFVNSGTLAVAASAAFTGLEQTTSSGLITMADNSATGSLTLSGDFVGTGGTLALDVDFAGSSDRLVIAGAASGSTRILLNNVGGAVAFNQSIVLVDAGEGTEAGAFFTDGSLFGEAVTSSPFVQLMLEFDAANNDFLLTRTISGQTLEATKLAEAAQSLWYQSADAWGRHRRSAAFDSSDASPLWMEIYASNARRDDTAQFATGMSAVSTVLDYQQDGFGIQAGYRLIGGGGDGFGLDLTLGYLNSNLGFDTRGNGARFGVVNFGGAASYKAGGFYADALVKYDTISGKLRDISPQGFQGDLDGDAFGARAQIGYRLGGEQFFIEPQLSLDYQQTRLDDLALDLAGFEFEDVDGLRGSAGVRLGLTDTRANGTAISYYLGASAVHEFEGEAQVRFAFGNQAIAFTNNPIDTYGHLEAGLSIQGKGALSGYFQVEGDVSDDYTSFGGRVGVRLRF